MGHTYYPSKFME